MALTKLAEKAFLKFVEKITADVSEYIEGEESDEDDWEDYVHRFQVKEKRSLPRVVEAIFYEVNSRINDKYGALDELMRAVSLEVLASKKFKVIKHSGVYVLTTKDFKPPSEN